MKVMQDQIAVPTIETAADFFAYALAIEVEASERYADLADQMAMHNNPEVASLFRKMADIESEHHARISEKAKNAKIDTSQRSFSWLIPEGPETSDFGEVHYLMTAYHALQIARLNEERAVRFFEAIAGTAADPKVKAFATDMANEERQHVGWIDEWLKRYPAPEHGWDDDFDPPVRSD